jgi:hypothetical protein
MNQAHIPHGFSGEQQSEAPVFTPQDLAHTYSQDWGATDPHVTAIETPFRLRPGVASVLHVLAGQEYMVVKDEEPYRPPTVWEDTELARHKLPKVAEADSVSVFLVPPDLVTLSSVMNDAIDGDSELFISVFGEIGAMFRAITDIYAGQHRFITSAVTIDDIAFVKGRKEPLLLPPFSLDLEATGESPMASLARDIYLMPLDITQQQVVEDALVAFEDSYERRRSD